MISEKTHRIINVCGWSAAISMWLLVFMLACESPNDIANERLNEYKASQFDSQVPEMRTFPVDTFCIDSLPYGTVIGGTIMSAGEGGREEPTGTLTIQGEDGKVYSATVPYYIWDIVEKGQTVGTPKY